jgi:MFS family permease
VSRAVKAFGVRRVTVYCATMVFLGAALRCTPLADGAAQRTLMIVAMLCNGAGGAWLNFGAPVLSELWFPSSERTMATAIASVATYAGAALGFVVGPLVVGTPGDQASARAAVRTLFYIEAAFCALCLVCCVMYYPDRPEHPPSEAAAAKRAEENAASAGGMMLAEGGGGGMAGGGASVAAAAGTGSGSGGVSDYFCCCNRSSSRRQPRRGRGSMLSAGGGDGFGGFGGRSDTSFDAAAAPAGGGAAHVSARAKYWILSISMAIPLGVYQGWNSTLFTCVRALDITQDEAAWLGFFMTMSGCAGSVLVGAILDRFAGRLKLVTELLMLIAMTSFGVFSANAASLLPLSHATSVTVAYVTGIVGGMALNISVPLFFELIMETIYGWGDEGAGSMLTILINTVVQIAFLVALAGADKDSSNLWTSWANAISIAVCFVVLLFLRVDYRRLSIDEGTALERTGVWFDRALGCY